MSICFIFLCVRSFYLPVCLVALSSRKFGCFIFLYVRFALSSYLSACFIFLFVCLLYLPVCLLVLSSCFSYLLVSPSVSCGAICLLYFPVCRFDSFFSFSSFPGMVASLLPRPTCMLLGHPVCLDICDHFLLLFLFVVCNLSAVCVLCDPSAFFILFFLSCVTCLFVCPV